MRRQQQVTKKHIVNPEQHMGVQKRITFVGYILLTYSKGKRNMTVRVAGSCDNVQSVYLSKENELQHAAAYKRQTWHWDYK